MSVHKLLDRMSAHTMQILGSALCVLVLMLTTACGSASSTSRGDQSLQPTDTSLLEDGEELSGGQTTVFNTTPKAFSQFAANLTFEQQGDFKIGNSFFEQDWVSAPSTTTARDGLGPIFNARSCSACHTRDGRGSPPEDSELQEAISLLIRLSIPGDTATGGPQPDPVYGGQFNPRSVNGVDPEGSVRISYEEIAGQYADGSSYSLRKPAYNLINLNYGDLHPDIMMSPRVAPQMVGMGLLEAISEEDILSREDEDDANGDGISGRANYVWDERLQDLNLGRFGWKANRPTVEQQVAGAFNGDIGITSTIFPDSSCTADQLECLAAPNGGEFEIEDDILDFVVFYSQTLAVPARRNWDNPDVLAGKKIFNDLGCVQCHTPQMTTSEDFPIAELAGQTIRPYTDLLLHDMGDALSDGREDFGASANEWRTPPLWGIGLFQKVNGHTTYMHDGRARNLEEAVLWHGGEAKAAQEAFVNLDSNDRENLIKFLNSL